MKNDQIKILSVRHAWPEKNPIFEIDRPFGCEYYVFIHLWQSVNMEFRGERFITKPSACLLFSPGEAQKWAPLPGGIIHDWIHISGDMEPILCEAGLEANRIYYPKNPSFITNITSELETEFFAKKKHSEEITELKIRELFFRISRRIEDDDAISPDTTTVNKLKDLRRETFDNLKVFPGVAKMAKRLSVSESKFYAIYKETFGISPTKDIINARIENAKIYLASGEYTVEQAAELVGYKNTFHFIRQFKQETGVTPGKYASDIKKEK